MRDLGTAELRPRSGLAEMRQRAFEVRRCERAAGRLAELLELAGYRDEYKSVRYLQAKLREDLAAIER